MAQNKLAYILWPTAYKSNHTEALN